MKKTGLGHQLVKSSIPVFAFYCIKPNDKVNFYSAQQPQVRSYSQFINRMFTRSNALEGNIAGGELAAKMQTMGFVLDQQAISNIENNERTVTDFEIAGFCKALRCSEKDLLQEFYEDLNS